jgi:hypothetical protein
MLESIGLVILGSVLGYCSGSYIESFLHEYVSDALPKYVRIWKRFPKLCAPLLNAHYSHHRIHHVKTWRQDHVTQFRSEEEKSKLDAELATRGRHGHIIKKGRYATQLYADGIIVFAAPLLLVGFLISNITPLSFALPFALAILWPVPLSWIIHPYLHMPFEKGQQQAPVWIAWLLRTGYFKAMYRHHFMHHRYGGTCCFNLALGADGFRKRNRAISQKDRDIMIKIGMPLH